MRNPFFYILLFVLVVLDGWLLAHPNVVGQLQDFYLDRTYFETVPNALGVVAVVVGVALLLAWMAGRLGRSLGVVVLLGLLAASAYWLFSTFMQYNSGFNKLTGAGFRSGAILLPGLVVLVFGKALFDLLQPKPRRR